LAVRFRHYKEEELKIGRRFAYSLKGYQKIETDVRLYPRAEDQAEHFKHLLALYGRSWPEQGPADERILDEPTKKMLLDLHALRIDMVVHWTLELWIVEIKDEPRPSAVGELKTYAALYKRQFHPLKMVKLKLVCEGRNPMVEEACRSEGIEVIRV